MVCNYIWCNRVSRLRFYVSYLILLYVLFEAVEREVT